MNVVMEDIKVVPGRELFQKDREAGMGVQIGEHTYKIAAFYEIGDWDMFRNAYRNRGFWLMCRPMKFEANFTTMSLFDAGLRQFEEEVGRFNAKKFDKFVDAHFIWNEAEERVDFSPTLLALVNKVVSRHLAGVTG